jgi:LysM repeat protein
VRSGIFPGRSSIRTTDQSVSRDINTRLTDLQQELKNPAWYKRLSKQSKRKVIRYSLLTANVALLAVVAAFVLQKPQTTGTTVSNAILASEQDSAANPLDTLSSADIAVSVARVTGIAEQVSVENLADTVNAQLAITPSDDIVVAQPAIIATGLRSRADIQNYIVQKGDTVPKVAKKFGVTSETIRWTNTITGDELTVGQTIIISPVNGIVYKIKNGDTIDSLVSRYRVNRDQFIAFNDLESGRLPSVGQRVVLPDGKPPQAGVAVARGGSAPTQLLWGGGGGYDAGWCTWYAAAKAGVPGGWGNANTWHLYAPLSGWSVSTVPRVGAVAQTSAGWAGHVGYVEAVELRGGQYYIKYSDMNGIAGFNRVGYSDWVSAQANYQRFIYR